MTTEQALINNSIRRELKVIKRDYCDKYACLACPCYWGGNSCSKTDLESNLIKAVSDGI